MTKQVTVGQVLQDLSGIKLPNRDRKEVREFALSLPKNQNALATKEQVLRALELIVAPSSFT